MSAENEPADRNQPAEHRQGPPPEPLPPLRWWEDGRRLAIIGGVLFFVAYMLQQARVPDDPFRRPTGGVVSIPGIGTFAFWGR